MDLSPQEIKANIEKLKNSHGDARTGGKGSQRRKVKVVAKAQGSSDKVVKNLVKKTGAQPLGVDEVNFFMDDNTVLHFINPETYASIQSNTFIVSGEPATKTIKDLLPDIIQQLGPKQHTVLRDLILSSESGKPEEEAPQLVQTGDEPTKPEETKDNLDKVQ